MSKQLTWKQLLQLCQEHGKDKVLEMLEAIHKNLEGLEASYWAEPEMHRHAKNLRQALLKQDETIIKLRNMTDEDIKVSLG